MLFFKLIFKVDNPKQKILIATKTKTKMIIKKYNFSDRILFVTRHIILKRKISATDIETKTIFANTIVERSKTLS